MKIIAVINEKPMFDKILNNIGESTYPPRLTPARGPLKWEGYNRDRSYDDTGARLIPDYQFDQCFSW